MKAIILTAGLGTRMLPFTESKPKCMVPVLGKPLLSYIIRFLKSQGVTELIINLHHHPKVLPDYFGDGSDFGVKIEYSHEQKLLGTGGAIKKVLEQMSENFLVVNGDVLADFNLKELFTQQQNSQNLATVGIYAHPLAQKYGMLGYNKQQITSILSPVPSSQMSGMFGSYYLISKNKIQKIFSDLPDSFCIVKNVFANEVKNHVLGAFKINGFWHVCDSLEDVEHAEKRLLALPGYLNI